jgi:hypothetical protein
MLPKNLNFKSASKVESAACRSWRSNLAPQNGTGPYQLGDTIIFNIPAKNNQCLSTLDSYLKFTLPGLATGSTVCGFRFGPAGAHSIIDRIRIWSGSNLLEDITQYGVLASLMNDLQVPTDSFYGKNTILQGTRNDLVTRTPTIEALTGNTIGDINVALAQIGNQVVSCNQINSGESLRESVGGGSVIATGKTTGEQTYCLNLISILGCLTNSVYFPLFACKSSGLRLEITLVSSLAQMGAVLGTVTAPNGVMRNVEFVCQMLELSDPAMGTISQSLQGQPLQFVVPSYRNYQYTTSAMTSGNATSVSFAIPAKVSSLKSIFITQRDKGTGALTFFPHSSITGGLGDYNFRIGSEIMPPKSPSTITEMFCEVIRAIDSLGNVNHQPSIEKATYSMNASAANSAGNEANNASYISSGSFAVGLDTESYTSADKSTIFSGLSTLNSDIYFQGNYNPPANQTLRLDAFCLFDNLLVFENDVCYSKN